MRQKHGQNFLFDKNIAKKIVQAADLDINDEVLEIGPGKGILTEIMAPLVKNITAVEIDKNLCQNLKASLPLHNIHNVNIINADFIHFDFQPKNPYKIVSNLPYNAATAIIQKVLPNNLWTTSVFMLQKEVSLRISSGLNLKTYGYLSLFCSYYANIFSLFDVSPNCFHPKPKVNSGVIKLINKKNPPPDENLFTLIKFCFSMRRKTILNSLTAFTGVNKMKMSNFLNYHQFNPQLRPASLSLVDYLALTNAIQNIYNQQN
ncbi:MAG: 16S rRNA (adenine(1518)-N(6)/adenine(1519)-N(6))-dimethyltransferase RsmA [Elusimicrobiota bacterium]|jgi:16S rRNA (adenine1518-N6/adenine1519-N6)-dimethyltransferase|nr:16S rRNA (adenine(1518)-N(6)/adenine(1519)-N(6))-dimethyltransferase RsmA [Elusimicrobiota bacterium]